MNTTLARPLAVSRPTGLAALALASAAALAAPVRAQCGTADDGLEPNDTCAEALALALPFHQPGLFVHRHDPDFYRVTIPPGQDLTVELEFVDDDGDVDLTLYDPGAGCGDLWSNLAAGTSNSNGEHLVLYNEGATPRDVIVMVHMWRGALPMCNTYSLRLEAGIHDPACSPLLHDDGLEDNDDCGGARPLPAGATVGLWVSRDDEDFYSVRLQPGATLDVAAHFEHGRSDIDLFLYDAHGACGGGFGTGELARSFSQSDDERIVWTNNGASARDLIVHVDVFDYHSCNDYDLAVTIDGQGVGQAYCEGAVNAVGLRGRTASRGSARVAEQDLVLEAHDLPPHSVGFFLCSRTRGQVPGAGGSVGTLCLGGDIGRLDHFILASGHLGYFELPLPFAALPQSGGLASVQPNDGWFFQAWYRDRSGGLPTSNFTNGLAVGFE